MALEDQLTRLLGQLSAAELVAWAELLPEGRALGVQLEACRDQPRAAVQAAARALKWLKGPDPYLHLLAVRPDLVGEVALLVADAGLSLLPEERAKILQSPGPQLVGVSDEVQGLSSRLEAAYRRLEEAGERGDSRELGLVQAAILDLRRAMRAGPALKAGDFLADGRYKLTERLGHGGFATVWGAWDRQLRRPVAIKVLHHQHAEDRSRLERFFRGARLMSELNHPGVVRVLEPRRDDAGYHFFVMERLTGGDLHHAVRDGALAGPDALWAVLEVGEALAFAHSRGVVHRDVKPQNILLNGRGGAALTDFDLVKAADTTGGTKSGALGTFLYAAPEAMKAGHEADGRADVFSLAMTAVFCLHGADIPAEALYEREAFLEELGCSAALRAVLTKATAIRPERRYASMEAFCEALRGAMRAQEAPPAAEPDAPSTEGVSKYDPLARHLAAVADNVESVTLSFGEVEAILGFSLPISARKHRSWWGNHEGGQRHARAWLRAGWRVAGLNVTEGVVTFTQLFGAAGDYIRFFGLLISEVQRLGGGDVWDSPNGQSSHRLFPLAAGGSTVGWIRVGFSRAATLRVEAYLDTGDRDGTKQVFDLLFSRRRPIGDAAGVPLVWDRLDDRRASRVSWSFPGRVSDAPEVSRLLAAHAAEMSLLFRRVLQGALDEAARSPQSP